MQTYRDGEQPCAIEAIAENAFAGGDPDGRAAIVDGHDLFRAQVEQVVSEAGLVYDYSEIDPDVFGEELEAASYRDVERIAAVSLVVCG